MIFDVATKESSTISIYISLTLSVLFVFINLPLGGLKFDWLVFVLMFSFVVHYLTTPDKLTTMVNMIMTLLLYETLQRASINVTGTMVTVFAVFLISYIMTWNEMLTSLLTTHTGRMGLYDGIFQNSNTNGGFSLFTFFLAVLFCNNKTVRNIFILLTVTSILASGSRNAILCFVLFFVFLFIQKSRIKRFTFASFVVFLLLLIYYLLYIELNHDVDFNIMGKEANSAGRSEQINMVIAAFPLGLFGNGKDVVDSFTIGLTGYSVHNFYVNSLYSMGIFILVGYFAYIFRLYRNALSSEARAALLAANIFFFFEPGVCFYPQMLNVYPLLIVIMKMNQDNNIDSYYENSSRDFQF